MFGDLFDDDAPRLRTRPRLRGSVSPAPLKAPPLPRPESGFCGLANQGATCYLNCLLQTLYMTPEFKYELFSLSDEELGSDGESQKNGKKARIIPIQLRRLFARLALLDQKETQTTELTDSFGWQNNEELHQHDVQELNRILFGAIEESLYGTSGQELIKNLYHGNIVNKIVCQECGYTSEREEDFLDLCVAVAGNLGLENSLHQYYSETERLAGRNQYSCEMCQKLVNATRSARVRRLPAVLTISLLRFSFDFSRMERFKETGRFSFPMLLNMRQYCEEQSDPAEYELYSVIIHRGSAHGGHYHAYIRDLCCLGNWSEPDDITITPLKKKSDDVNVLELETPQNVIESVLLNLKTASLDQICSEIVRTTGVSWNKRYKPKYGPISKFLKKFEEKFCVTDGMVTLKDAGFQNGTAHAPEEIDEGAHWFDFNDGHIQPIRTSEIQHQFSGRESGYMLIYQRKNAENPIARVPKELMNEILTFNEGLEKERVEYDRAQNETTFTVIQPKDIELSNGIIQLVTTTENLTKIPLDRRKNTNEFHKILLSHHECQNARIHVAKNIPAGLHLYSEIPENSDRTLNDFVTDSQVQIFVWTGSDVGGKGYHCGKEHEPIILGFDFGDSSQQLPFHKSMKLKEVLERVDVKSHCTVRIVKGGDTSQPVTSPPEDLDLSLFDLDLEDYDQISVSGRGEQARKNVQSKFVIQWRPEPPNEDPSETPVSSFVNSLRKFVKSRWKSGRLTMTSGCSPAPRPGLVRLVVENRLGEETEHPETVIEAQHDQTIESLRLDVLRHLSIDSETTEQSCRLRIDDDFCGLQPPLRLKLSLKSQNFKNGTRLVLENGQSPNDNQISLTFKMADSSLVRTMDRVEMNVDNSWTVAKCCEEAETSLRLEGCDWFLQMTSWSGEAGLVLSDGEESVLKVGWKDGDTVLVQQGRPLPTGFLRPHVWLYPSLTTDDGLRRAWLKHNPDDHLAAGDQPHPTHLGEIQISKTASTTELKQTIMTLPLLSGHVIPSPGFLRVRKVEQGCQTGILREAGNLNRQKVATDGILAVEVLSEEEKLSPNQIIMNVMNGFHEAVEAPVELCVNLDSVNTYKKLSQLVCDHLGLEPQHCILAKHLRDKYEWILMRENKFSNNKKKNQTKVNFRGQPYFLKDGDTITVKSSARFPHPSPDDFLTEDDRKGKERLRMEAEEKRRRRREVKTSVGPEWLDTKPIRKEHSLNIRVENFRVA